jgi:glycosyltransferase involved in cell wall biosynthesis
MAPKAQRSAEPSPLVSVIVPVYLGAPYIAGTLESVLAQSFTSYEIIVVNDGSPDTQELERVLDPYWGRIRYIVQDNRGQAGARNTGIRESRGTFVAFLDQDDQWEPEFLGFQTGILQADPGLDVHYCDARIFGDSPRSGRCVMEFTPSNGDATFHALIRRDCTVLNCAALSRKETIVRVGMFDESFRYGEDIGLWLRTVRQGGRIGYQRKVLARCRIRGDSISADVARMIEGYLRVLSEIRSSPNVTPSDIRVLDRQIATERAELDLMRGKEALRENDVKTAIEHFQKANVYRRQPKISASLFLMRYAPKMFLSLYRRAAN